MVSVFFVNVDFENIGLYKFWWFERIYGAAENKERFLAEITRDLLCLIKEQGED